jgi:DNA-binding transcriptional LysR family regulator
MAPRAAAAHSASCAPQSGACDYPEKPQGLESFLSGANQCATGNGALRAFRLIAELGTFTRAAGVLGVTPSALSQTLRQLEERLGVRLLQRTTRRVGLTEAGAGLLARITPPLARSTQHSRTAPARRRARRHLRLTVPQIVTRSLLHPMLKAFLDAYPRITLDLRVENNLADLVGQASMPASAGRAARARHDRRAVGGQLRSAVVGSPAYFKHHGRPQHPRDLARHNCVRYASTAAPVYRWEFAKAGRWFETAVDGNLIVNDNDARSRRRSTASRSTTPSSRWCAGHSPDGRLESVLDDFHAALRGVLSLLSQPAADAAEAAVCSSTSCAPASGRSPPDRRDELRNARDHAKRSAMPSSAGRRASCATSLPPRPRNARVSVPVVTISPAASGGLSRSCASSPTRWRSADSGPSSTFAALPRSTSTPSRSSAISKLASAASHAA